jgi:hypothetical protein
LLQKVNKSLSAVFIVRFKKKTPEEKKLNRKSAKKKHVCKDAQILGFSVVKMNICAAQKKCTH